MKYCIIICLIFSNVCFGQWDNYSMHFPQSPKAGGWDIGPRNNTFTAADDFLCTKSGKVNNIIFWGSWQEDLVGIIDSFLITIYETSIKEANVVWKGAADNEYNPDRSEFQFTVKPMPPVLQGWYDVVDYDPTFPQNSYDINDHQKWDEINAHNFEIPIVLQAGTTYWIKIDEMWISDPNYIDDGTYHLFPTIGWKESDKHFGSKAKIYCGPCTGWKLMSDPITGSAIDLAFVVMTAPPPADITKDGKVDYHDIRALANSWLDNNLQTIDGQTVCIESPYGDLNEDCLVNYDDFTIVAKDWMFGKE